jgi:polyphosphate kinase
MDDRSDSWDLDGNGTWTRRAATSAEPHFHLQEALLRRIIGKVG